VGVAGSGQDAVVAQDLLHLQQIVSGISIIPSHGIRIFPTHLMQGASDGTGRTTA
jgi:hypothetical protein